MESRKVAHPGVDADPFHPILLRLLLGKPHQASAQSQTLPIGMDCQRMDTQKLILLDRPTPVDLLIAAVKAAVIRCRCHQLSGLLLEQAIQSALCKQLACSPLLWIFGVPAGIIFSCQLVGCHTFVQLSHLDQLLLGYWSKLQP